MVNKNKKTNNKQVRSLNEESGGQDDVSNYSNNNYTRLSLLLSNVGMRTLRLLLRERYKALTNTELEVGETCVNQEFLFALNDSPFVGYPREARQVKEAYNVNKWDFEVLIHILSIGMSTREDDALPKNPTTMSPSKRETKRKQEEENEDLKVLSNVKRSLDHHLPGHSLPTGDYEELWKTAAGALLRLGATEKDLEHLRSCQILAPHELKPKVVSVDNERKSKALRARAEESISKGNCKGGQQLYAEALLLRGLSAGEKSSILFGRSQHVLLSHLEDKTKDYLETDAAQKSIDGVLEGARLVIQLEPKGWRGYFLEGKCFQLRQHFNEAIDSFELALTFNPNSEEVLKARSECRLELSDIESQIGSDDPFTPTRLSDIFQSREEIERALRENELMMKSDDPSERVGAMLFMGHRYQLGDEVPLDLVEATECFWQAALGESSEGAYYAGLNFLGGIGYQQDIPQAVDLFGLADNCGVKVGLENRLHNNAMARAKFVLGMLCQHGVGEARSYAKAAHLYRDAAVEGCGPAAMSLARMYFVGMGTPQDLGGALQYQRLAVEQGSGGARGMNFLGRIYAEIGDLPQARYWSERAITLGYTAPSLERQDFEELLQQKEQQFEKLRKKLPAHVVSSKGPIHTLHARYVKRLGPARSALKGLVREMFLENQALASSDFCEPVRAEPSIAEVNQFAADGQEYAQILLEALEHRNLGTETFEKLLANSYCRVRKKDPAAEMKLKGLVLSEFAACYTVGVGQSTASMSTECRSKLMEVATEFVQDEGRSSNSDLNAGIVRLNLLMEESAEEASDFAKVCKALYPEEPHFYERRAYVLGLLGRHEEGTEEAEEGLECFPNNWQLLYTRARHLCRLVNEPPRASKKVGGLGASHSDKKRDLYDVLDSPTTRDSLLSNQIQAFQEFLRRAPSGHPNIPEAHYQLANLFHISADVSEFEAQLGAGVEAEKSLLSHFLPYESSAKKLAERSRKRNTESAETYEEASKQILETLLERDDDEIRETLRLKLTNPKRTVIVTEIRRRFLSREIIDDEAESRFLRGLGFVRSRTVVRGQHKQQKGPTPPEIPWLMMSRSLNFEDMDPTIDQVHGGRVMNLTIMEEYVDGNKQNPIQTIVKDDNDDFSLIFLFNFDRSNPSIPRKLGFGSRIRLMNPYLSLMSLSEYGGPVLRVDDPSSLLFLSSGEENNMCRYCWKRNPKPRCTKCMRAQYCDRECQRLDWTILGHKDLCKLLRKPQEKPPRYWF